MGINSNQEGSYPSKTFIGLDIGKTKIAVGLILENGKVIEQDSLPTDIVNGGEAILDQGEMLINKMINHSNIEPLGIGIGSSGVIDHATGTIISSGSIPKWNNIKIKYFYEKEFRLPVLVDNDVYVAALGEHFFGAGMGMNTSVFLVISTGIGFCTIENGKIWRGSHNLAGQIAHIPLFGKEETVNDLFSGRGIAENASRLRGYKITTKEAFILAAGGNAEAKKVIDHAIEGAALTIAWIQNSIDPEVLIVGGGVAINENYFIASVKRKTEEFLGKYSAQLPKGINIVPAKLSKNAGIIGGAALFISRQKPDLDI
jgi:glucokinase